MLERLRKFDLFIKLLKCAFSIIKIDFLDYHINIIGILMNTRRVITIIN